MTKLPPRYPRHRQWSDLTTTDFASLDLARTIAVLPLGASAYGYSPGAWAGYDPSFDNGYKGYDRPVHYRDNYSPYENGAFGQGGNYYYGPTASWGDARGGDDYYSTAY